MVTTEALTDFDGVQRPLSDPWDIGPFEFVPALTLYGMPAHHTIDLSWVVNLTLPVTATWQIAYEGPTGDEASPITNISHNTRAYTLTGLTNYTPYTVTLHTMVASSPMLTDTVVVRPTDLRTLFTSGH